MVETKEVQKLDLLSSQMKQKLHNWTKQDIHDLTEKKKNCLYRKEGEKYLG